MLCVHEWFNSIYDTFLILYSFSNRSNNRILQTKFLVAAAAHAHLIKTNRIIKFLLTISEVSKSHWNLTTPFNKHFSVPRARILLLLLVLLGIPFMKILTRAQPISLSGAITYIYRVASYIRLFLYNGCGNRFKNCCWLDTSHRPHTLNKNSIKILQRCAFTRAHTIKRRHKCLQFSTIPTTTTI